MNEFVLYTKDVLVEHKELLKLSGVFGVHPINIYDNFFYKINFEGEDQQIAIVEVKSDFIKRLLRTIDRTQRKIKNRIIQSTGLQKNLALRCLVSQVAFAVAADFKEIELTAWRNDNDDDTYWIGYIIWGKYGFLMKDEFSRGYVLNMIDEYKLNDIKYKNIYGLLNNKTGLKRWKQEGIIWEGYFDLSIGSYSRYFLKAAIYKKRRIKILGKMKIYLKRKSKN